MPLCGVQSGEQWGLYSRLFGSETRLRAVEKVLAFEVQPWVLILLSIIFSKIFSRAERKLLGL